MGEKSNCKKFFDHRVAAIAMIANSTQTISNNKL